MYIEPVFRSNSDGSVRGPYYRAVQFAGGRRVRHYVQQDHMHTVHGQRGLLHGFTDSRIRHHPLVYRRTCGQPPKISKQMRDLYEAAGYRVRGERLIDRRNVDQDPDAMAVRFSLLSDEYQRRIGNPDRLAYLYQDAQRRLRSAHRRQVRGYTLAQAFEDALEAEEKNDGHLH